MDDLIPGDKIYFLNEFFKPPKISTGIFSHYEDGLVAAPARAVWAYWDGRPRLGFMPSDRVFRVAPKKVEYNDEEWV
jgi:hypothetical protein